MIQEMIEQINSDSSVTPYNFTVIIIILNPTIEYGNKMDMSVHSLECNWLRLKW